jgi:HAD superfamily hydrolase (TIGR01509 family)
VARERQGLELSREGFDAVIFDLDGVITDTASVHAMAWGRMFDRFLAERPAREGEDHRPFSDEDYYLYVDGKPRYDGVESFLGSRGIRLRRGNAGYPSSIELLHRLRASGWRTAIISASRNCVEVLEAAAVAGLFDVKVDGVDAEELGLSGKPDPAVFLEAATRLGVEPSRCAVVEDALAGVEAGRRGRFGLVIGVDRGGHAEALREQGADVVVGDLGQVLIPERGDER